MRNYTRVLLFVTVFAVATSAMAGIRVAVTPFEAGDYSLNQYTEYARGELENLIVSFVGIEVVERSRMDEMAQELAFGNFSGMADAGKVAQFGNMAGAKILVTGSILKVEIEEKGFGGLGISTRSSKAVATVRIRAYDVEKGTVIYSQNFKSDSSGFGGTFGRRGRSASGGSGKRDKESAAIESAMKSLAEDSEFKDLFTKLNSSSSQAAKLKIEIDPTPDNCDVEVNDVYLGSTPITIELTQGVAVTIKLTKGGFLPWEKKVLPTPGMRITPELEGKQ